MNPPSATTPALDPDLRAPEIIGAGALGKLVFDGADPALLRRALLEDLRLAPHHPSDQREATNGSAVRAKQKVAPPPATQMDLGLLALMDGRREEALQLQAQALVRQSIFRVAGLQPAAAAPRLRLLALVAPGDLMANTPLEFILTGSEVSLDLLYVQPGVPLPEVIPDHDVAFVSICQSEDNDPLLQCLIPLVHAWPRPVINNPARLLQLSREAACAQLRGAPGIVIPPTLRLPRAALGGSLEMPRAERASSAANRSRASERPTGATQEKAGPARPAWASQAVPPIIIRPVGSHAGHGLEKIEDAAALGDYLARQPPEAAEFYLSPYADYRSPDGQFRKYRIVFIDGQPFLCHLAIADDWMVHYVTADMQRSAANRAEEDRAMASFDRDFARRHAAAFLALTERFGLDYFGVDCAETPAGELLIFEVASAMVIHAMDSPQLYPYKQAQMQKTFAAFHHLLDRVAEGASADCGSLACR